MSIRFYLILYFTGICKHKIPNLNLLPMYIFSKSSWVSYFASLDRIDKKIKKMVKYI